MEEEISRIIARLDLYDRAPLCIRCPVCDDEVVASGRRQESRPWWCERCEKLLSWSEVVRG